MQGVAYTSEQKEEIINNIIAFLSGGAGRTITQACITNRVSVAEFYSWKAEVEGLDQRIKDAREIGRRQNIDLAMTRVAEAINTGDMKTTRWYLEMHGKDDGFVKRSEITGKDGKDLNPKVIETFLTAEEAIQKYQEIANPTEEK